MGWTEVHLVHLVLSKMSRVLERWIGAVSSTVDVVPDHRGSDLRSNPHRWS